MNVDQELGLMNDVIGRLEQMRKQRRFAIEALAMALLERRDDQFKIITFNTNLTLMKIQVPWVVLVKMHDHLEAIVVDDAKTLAKALLRRQKMERGKHEDAQDPTQPH